MTERAKTLKVSSSSHNSRFNASSCVFPASIFPPGNSHQAFHSPYPRWVAKIRPSESWMIAATTSICFVPLRIEYIVDKPESITKCLKQGIVRKQAVDNLCNIISQQLWCFTRVNAICKNILARESLQFLFKSLIYQRFIYWDLQIMSLLK